MGIKVRKKILKGGFERPVLDINYRGTRRFEHLPMKLKIKPMNAVERKLKKEQEELIKRIVNQRERELLTNQYSLDPVQNVEVNFLKFFDEFIQQHPYADARVYKGAFSQLKAYIKKEILYCHQITPVFTQKFAQFLESKLTGITPYNYFKKFKKVVREALKQKFLLADPTQDVKMKKGQSAMKDILTADDLRLLFKSHCPNSNVKRAFLFSCFTGLRFCDIKILQWKHIKDDRLELIQQKTNFWVCVNLNDDAKKLLDVKHSDDGYIFKLPSHTGCLKALRTWTKNANINKHITWHCARHSFATALIRNGVDVFTTSKLLGHTSLKYTTTYTRYNDKLGREAVEKLPQIFLFK